MDIDDNLNKICNPIIMINDPLLWTFMDIPLADTMILSYIMVLYMLIMHMLAYIWYVNNTISVNIDSNTIPRNDKKAWHISVILIHP
mgnify:CR=1 FL=1